MELSSRKRKLSDGAVISSSSNSKRAASGDQDLPRSPDRQPFEAIERRRQAGHSYAGFDARNHSKNHLGDRYTVNNYGKSPVSEDSEGQRCKRFMEALAFKRMDFRRATIDPAYSKTCQWVFEENGFLKWRNADYRNTNHGFFWIKGKPGSGKSTLMKCILEHIQKQMPKSTVISFFFNAKGQALEHTAEGCYRSLLHQLLQKTTGLCELLQLPDYFSKGQTWELATVQDLFRQAVLVSSQQNLVLIIDALDECDEDEVRDIVDFVDGLAQHSEELYTCLASRHYPNISTPFCEDLVIDRVAAHTNDIQIYLERKLNLRLEKERLALAREMTKKSRGVFLWIVLVVRLVNTQSDRGEGLATLLESISALPGPLETLISNILTGEDPDDYLLPTLLWTLVGDSEMSLKEMYGWIKWTTGSANSQSAFSCSAEQMKRFIVHASRGLVEVARDVRDATASGSYLFQFIHESVRQYVIAGGLAALGSDLSDNVEARGHAIAAEWCKTYVLSCESADFASAMEPSSGTVAWATLTATVDQEIINPDIPERMREKFPMLLYAHSHCFFHLNTAYVGGEYDLRCLQDFPLQIWLHLSNILLLERFSDGSPYESSASLLHLLLENGNCNSDPGIIRGLFDRFDVAIGSDHTRQEDMTPGDRLYSDMIFRGDLDHYGGGEFCTPLIAAVIRGLYTYVELFITHGADVNVHDSYWGSSLSVAARDDSNIEVVHFLIDHGAQIDFIGGRDGSPLGAAAYSKSVKMAELLISKGADVALRDSTGCNIALRQALHDSDNAEMVALLISHAGRECLDKAAIILHEIARQRQTANLKTLVQLGADPHRRDPQRCTTLYSATVGPNLPHHRQRGLITIVTYLLELGVEVNAVGGEYGTVLTAASANGYEEVVRLLLDKGADFLIGSRRYGTPVEAAKSAGHKTIVDMLADAYIRRAIHFEELNGSIGASIRVETPAGTYVVSFNQNSGPVYEELEEVEGPGAPKPRLEASNTTSSRPGPSAQ